MHQESTGVSRLFSATDPYRPTRNVFNLFRLSNRVAIVTGGLGGIGLEIAFAYAEAGAVVYCIDLPQEPGEKWHKVKKYIDSLPDLLIDHERGNKGRLEYIAADVTDQGQIFAVAEDIATKEGRINICVACAGILRSGDCLEYTAEEFNKVINANTNGVFFTAQAAGRVMDRTGTAGSIILMGSMSGSVANKGMRWVAYNSSKGAIIQMAKAMAIELGPKKIRVNTISPGYIDTQMTKDFLDKNPHLMREWTSQNPMGRMGRPDELRGVALWLAGDGSTFCTGSEWVFLCCDKYCSPDFLLFVTSIKIDGGHTAW